MEPHWSDFFDWMLKAVAGGVGTYMVHILSEVKKSIDSLNERVAKVLERSEWHSKELDRLETRVERLELRPYESHFKTD